jgi:meiotically up-regulated gene 157 (Mug157) protein
LLPYVPLASSDPQLSELICGLIHRHKMSVLHDPFANAWNFNASGAGHQDDIRRPPMTPLVFEGKYELDSLAAVLKLAAAYYNATGDKNCFLTDSTWVESMTLLVSTIQSMQPASGLPSDSPYSFQRLTYGSTDTLQLGGMGPPSAYTGMSRSLFRPSDDACTFPFLIPSQAMAVVELRNLAAMIGNFLETISAKELHQLGSIQIKQLSQLSSVAAQVAEEIDSGIQGYGVVEHNVFGKVLAYEVDGFGSINLMDDANIPSLLSLPYLGYLSSSDPLYLSTRSLIWSTHQPYYWSGDAGEGIGGPHAGINQIWPMSIIMYALTSTNDNEIKWALQTLKLSSANTGFLHESFNKDNVNIFTRPWFAWVNALFGELIMKIAKERPQLIFKQEE